MTEYIGHISAAITVFKGLIETSKIYNDSAYKLEIAKINDELTEAQIQETKMKNKINELETMLEELKNNPLKFNGIVYFDNDNFPYCPACYDNCKKRIHLKATPKNNGYHLFYCSVCQSHYHEEDRYNV